MEYATTTTSRRYMERLNCSRTAAAILCLTATALLAGCGSSASLQCGWADSKDVGAYSRYIGCLERVEKEEAREKRLEYESKVTKEGARAMSGETGL